MEELAYYGIKYVLACGLTGGLGAKAMKMGDLYIVEKALALDGTTPHYTNDKLIPSDESLNLRIQELARKARFLALTLVQATTADAIYREYDQDLDRVRDAIS